MASKFRAASIYVRGKRMRFSTNGSANYTNNGQAVVIEDGYENHSQGHITSEVSMERAVPIGGDGSNLEEYFVEGEEVEVSMSMLNGKIHTIKPMTITACNFSWEQLNSTQTGNITLSGGKPKITG